MLVHEVGASGLEAQALATQLLQRTRCADPFVGVWEAADIQWWWRRPRPSDEIEKHFWLDDKGPVAGVMLTSESDGQPWQCDPMIVPGAGGVQVEDVWQRAIALGGEHSPSGVDIPVSDADPTFATLARRDGLVEVEHDSTGWLDAVDRPARKAFAPGFTIVDRSHRLDDPHHMRVRSGSGVAARLDECSLYDQRLDLAVQNEDGRTAAYALFWFDPVTRVGLVEPVRTEDEFQRQGLANAMLREGINRLIDCGAERVKISYGSEAAEATYRGVGFIPTSTATWYRR